VGCLLAARFACAITGCIDILDVRLHCCWLNRGLICIYVSHVFIHERLCARFGYVCEEGCEVCRSLMDVGKWRTESLWLVQHLCSDIGCLWLKILSAQGAETGEELSYDSMHALVERHGAVLT
jgi:hypothetical protein